MKIDKIIELTGKIIAEIKEKHGNETNVQGSLICPVCGNKLHYSIHYNGHIWSKCETNNCLEWME